MEVGEFSNESSFQTAVSEHGSRVIFVIGPFRPCLCPDLENREISQRGS